MPVNIFVRYRELIDKLQLERDALRDTVASSEVQLQQHRADTQQLQHKVTVSTV